MKNFDPERHGFQRIVDYVPGGVMMFECKNHPEVDGKFDIHRLNLYLSRDGAFVCVWNGLLEPTMTESMFELDVPAEQLRFQDIYFEQLFRGYIETEDEATLIFRALRIKRAGRALPRKLHGAPLDLRCEMMSRAS